MGKPAARLGDMTAHGGSIVVGLPTVLIGGMPAARVGDMHVCPMLNPGVPPPPHVGGPIMMGSPMVLIGGMPAARMGDMVTCAGPPDTIMLGCMTVLIGEGGSGSAAGGGAGGGAGASVQGANTSAKLAGPGQLIAHADTHFLDVTFRDKANLPVGGVMYSLKGPNNIVTHDRLAGPIKRGGVPQGNYEIKLRAIVNAKWSVRSAKVGNTVDMIVDTIGVDSGTKAVLAVYVKDSHYTDHLLATIESQVRSDRIKEQWKLEVDEKYLGLCAAKEQNKKYSQPFFFYRVTIDDLTERSGLLMYEDWVEVHLTDDDNKPIGNKTFKAVLPSGEIRKGTLDGQGKTKIQKLSPGTIKVEIDLS